jgi:hypothetical protein
MRLLALGAVAVGLAVAGCVTEQQIVQGKEDMLAAAGFNLRPADTPDRQAELNRLPPHRFVYQSRNGKLVYLYSDPTVCHCLYIGSEAAYQQYRRLALQKQIADEQVMAAQMNMDNGWNWGPWGPGWW